MDSLVVPLYDHLCKDDCVVCEKSEIPWPKFDCFDAGCVYVELISTHIVGGCRQERLYVTSMAELCLGVAADNLEVVAFLQDLILQGLFCEKFKANYEHANVHAPGHLELGVQEHGGKCAWVLVVDCGQQSACLPK